jgi:hypothetical protein
VHFGKTDYPPPEGLEHYRLLPGISRADADDVAVMDNDAGYISPKRGSKFKYWNSRSNLGFVDQPSVSDGEKEEEKEEEDNDEDSEQDREEAPVKPKSNLLHRLQ